MVEAQAGEGMADAGAISGMDYSCLEEAEEDMEEMQVIEAGQLMRLLMSSVSMRME